MRHRKGHAAVDLPRRGLAISVAMVNGWDQVVRNYIAIAESSDDGKTWWISFPGLPGVTSAASGPAWIVTQAPGRPPATSPDDLSEYQNPLVVLVACARQPAPVGCGYDAARRCR